MTTQKTACDCGTTLLICKWPSIHIQEYTDVFWECPIVRRSVLMCFGSVLHSTSYSMQEYTDVLWGCLGYDQKIGLVHLNSCYWLSVQLCPLTGETTVGRGAECEVCIPAKSLSRAHAVLMVDGGTHFIQDLRSRNKMYRGNMIDKVWHTVTEDCYIIDTSQLQTFSFSGVYEYLTLFSLL